MKEEMSASQKEAFNNREIWSKYCFAVKSACNYEDYSSLKVFSKEYPEQFKFYQKVHRLRSEMIQDIKAMKFLGGEVYFGTLTFNNSKNKNKIETKRKEAFEYAKKLFKYVLIVEEFGGDNGRYHIHFLASFYNDQNFNDFRALWHSRQNLERVDNNAISKYLASYVVKDLPRLHRNHALTALRKQFAKVKHKVFMNKVHKTPIEEAYAAAESIQLYDDLLEESHDESVVLVKEGV